MKNRTTFLIIILILCLSGLFLKYGSFKSESVKTAPQIDHTHTQKINKSPLMNYQINIARISHKEESNETPQETSHKESKLAFSTDKSRPFSKEDVARFSRIMTISSNFIDSNNGRKAFQKSEMDSSINYRKVLDQLQQTYPNYGGNRKEFIRQRVVSTNFILNTKHLTSKDCENTISAIAEQHSKAEIKSNKMNLEYDAAAISQRCSKDFYNSFEKYVLSQKFSDEIAAQIDYYLEQNEKSL